MKQILRRLRWGAALCLAGTVLLLPIGCARSNGADLATVPGALRDALNAGLFATCLSCSVGVSNLRDDSVLETGLMFGTATAAVLVEVSLNGGAWTAATDTSAGSDWTSWEFVLDDTIGWNHHSSNTIDVRSEDSNGDKSPSINLTVRKGVNRDINRDGYLDLALGAPAYDSSRGRAFIWLGSASGIATGASTDADTTLTGASGGDEFGTALALGDLNGDGYADLAVGAPVDGLNNQGAVRVFFGGSTGIANGDAGDADVMYTGPSLGDRFGESVALADVNGDDYADLATGAIKAASNGGGAVFVFHGAASPADTTASSADSELTAASAAHDFGSVVALGDVDGDGYADLAVSRLDRLTSGTDGSVYVFESDGTSGLPSVNANSADAELTAVSTSDRFGFAIAIGDADNDGYQDVAIGAPSAAGLTRGAAYVFESAGSTGIATESAATADSTLSALSAGDQMGFALAFGDVDGDGYADLATSAIAGHTNNGGAAFVFESDGAGGIPTTSAANADGEILASSANDEVGFAVTLLDVDGDGYSDFVAGSSTGGASDKGAAYVEESAGLSGIASVDAHNVDAILTAASVGWNFSKVLR